MLIVIFIAKGSMKIKTKETNKITLIEAKRGAENLNVSLEAREAT